MFKGVLAKRLSFKKSESSVIILLSHAKTPFFVSLIFISRARSIPTHFLFYAINDSMNTQSFISGIPAPIVGISIGIFSYKEYGTDEA